MLEYILIASVCVCDQFKRVQKGIRFVGIPVVNGVARESVSDISSRNHIL